MKPKFANHQRQKQSKKPTGGQAMGSNYGHIYRPQFVTAPQRQEILKYLLGLYPIWEERYSKNHPSPDGQNRRLLRPVYWLGNWQFACLNYYHPPKGIHNRCIHAEPYPRVMVDLLQQVESLVRQNFLERDVPRGWNLNTCLINYYGSQVLSDGKKLDTARVGEHKDFEPGPVASISFGERALIQFVDSSRKGASSRVVFQQWLEDSSLQIFGGEKLKKHLFHRVQRVDKKDKHNFKLPLVDFETRRINLTFRYVPWEHIVRYRDLPQAEREDTYPYIKELAQHSEFFKAELGSE